MCIHLFFSLLWLFWFKITSGRRLQINLTLKDEDNQGLILSEELDTIILERITGSTENDHLSTNLL